MPGFSYSAQKFTDLWRTTSPFYQKKALDMLKIESPLYDKLLGGGRFQGRNAGEGTRVVIPILAHKGSGHQFYNFDDVLPVTTAKVFEQMQFDWKLSASGYAFNDIVVGMNRQSKIVDMMKGLRKAFERDIADFYRMQLYSVGNGVKEWGGLQYLLSANPYAANLVVLQLPRGGAGANGVGVPGDNWEFWRNKAGICCARGGSGANGGIAAVSLAAGTTQAAADVNVLTTFDSLTAADKAIVADNVVSRINKALDCMLNRGKEIKLLVCNINWLRPLRYFLQSKLHVNNVPAERKEMAGFQYGIEIQGKSIMFDKWCPMNDLYMLNIDSFTSWYLKQFRFVEWMTKGLHNSFNREIHMAMISSFTCDMPRNNCMLRALDAQASDYTAGNQNGLGNAPTWMQTLPKTRNVCDLSAAYDYAADGFTTKSDDADIQSGPTGEKMENFGYSAAGTYVDPTTIPATITDANSTDYPPIPQNFRNEAVPFDVGDGVEAVKPGETVEAVDGTEITRLS
jgi:hypothetical protein